MVILLNYKKNAEKAQSTTTMKPEKKKDNANTKRRKDAKALKIS